MTTSRSFIPRFARLFVFSFFLLAAILFCLAPPQSKSAQGQSVPAVPAFPGAEGGGAVSKGGRDGIVVAVTNTQDYYITGTPIIGSLRYALEKETVSRTVIFRVSGVITLVDTIKIKDPYVTVAGQTAPASKQYSVAAYIAETAALTVPLHTPVFTFTLKVDDTAMITKVFTMPVTDTNSVFALRFGNAASNPQPYQVWLDNVAIFEIPPTSTVAAAAARNGIDESTEREEGVIADGDGDTAVGEEANVVVNEEASEDVNNRSLFLPFVSRTEQ